MILDSSALIALFLQEPRHEAVLDKLEAASTRAIGAPTLAEAGIVLTARMRRSALGVVARFVQEFEVATIPFGDDHWKEALDAFDRYGRGRHRAALNFGDCMTYAVARIAGDALLCVGDDFALTELPIA